MLNIYELHLLWGLSLGGFDFWKGWVHCTKKGLFPGYICLVCCTWVEGSFWETTSIPPQDRGKVCVHTTSPYPLVEFHWYVVIGFYNYYSKFKCPLICLMFLLPFYKNMFNLLLLVLQFHNARVSYFKFLPVFRCWGEKWRAFVCTAWRWDGFASFTGSIICYDLTSLVILSCHYLIRISMLLSAGISRWVEE